MKWQQIRKEPVRHPVVFSSFFERKSFLCLFSNRFSLTITSLAYVQLFIYWLSGILFLLSKVFFSIFQWFFFTFDNFSFRFFFLNFDNFSVVCCVFFSSCKLLNFFTVRSFFFCTLVSILFPKRNWMAFCIS